MAPSYRPIDVAYSSGSAGETARLLDWKAEKKMADIVGLLVDAELRRRAKDGG
jgi:hypothetical protein